MMVRIREKIEQFQELIDYKFNNEEFLIQALTTPQFGNEYNLPTYQFLEILGDSIVKIILILKMYQMGIDDPGEITKIKASLESDETFKKIAIEFDLERYIFKSEKQKIKDTRILADVFEAVCGAIFLDSNYNLTVVDEKIINRFYKDFEAIIENSTILNKNILLEFLQEKFKTSIFIKLDFEKRGLEHNPLWIAKNPQILDNNNKNKLIELPITLQSNEFRKKKDAEKDIYLKILNHIKNNQFE